MEHCKLQAGCLIIVLYIIFIYIREKKLYSGGAKEKLFEAIIAIGAASIIFDGVTAYTVNHTDKIPHIVNILLHLFFFLSLDAVMFLMFWYLLELTGFIPKRRLRRNLLKLPFVINAVLVIAFIPELSFQGGVITNYSMGVSVYSAFAMVGIYLIAAAGIFIRGFRGIDRRKKIIISTYLIASAEIAAYQIIFPEALITCIVPTLIILGTYLNQENPLFSKLKRHHDEMVMGFATLVENRDDNTGGHIYRTTAYVRLLAEKLREKKYYRETLTRDYLESLVTAAPLHDVGKIAIPDAILQKPGRLTPEEFEIMKTHAKRGGEIIQKTLGKEDEISYLVAMYHHEKWNGKGYPEGISKKEIPLCARIMAIAYVFDAVSSKRCYKDAIPLEKCFEIIENGSGQDFDPLLVEVFLECKDDVVAVYNKFQSDNAVREEEQI